MQSTKRNEVGLDSGSAAPVNILTELRGLCMEGYASSDIPKYLGGRCPRGDSENALERVPELRLC